VARKLAARQMPPVGKPRPDEKTYEAFVPALEAALDRAAAVRPPDPGRTPTLRRLNRTEYQNAIKDLLAVDVDATAMLPADEANHGFDSAPLGDLSADALGSLHHGRAEDQPIGDRPAPTSANSDTFRTPPIRLRKGTLKGFPWGRAAAFAFPSPSRKTANTTCKLAHARPQRASRRHAREARNGVLLDRKTHGDAYVKPPVNNEVDGRVDANLKARITVTAGPHDVGRHVRAKPASLLETLRQPYQAHYNLHRHPRKTPAIYQVSITGPYNGKGRTETPSRRRIFICERPRRRTKKSVPRRFLPPCCAGPIGGRLTMPPSTKR